MQPTQTLLPNQLRVIETILSINHDLGIQFVPVFGDHTDHAIDTTTGTAGQAQATSHKPTQTNAAFNPAILYLNSLGSGSRPAMSGVLQKLATIVSNGECTTETMPWWHLRAPHVKVIKAWLQEEYSPATANKYLAALRQTIQNCWELDLMSTDDYMRTSAVKNVKFKRPESAAGRHISYPELSAILSTCLKKRTTANIRDAAIISLAYGAGLRRAEIAKLKIASYSPGQGQLVISDTKHNSTRVVPTEASGLDSIIGLWLTKRYGPNAQAEESHAGGYAKKAEELPLFCRILKSGRMLTDKSLSPEAVSELIVKRAVQAGIEDITPHDFRRTFAGDLLDAGADISTVQKLMGHASSDTTASYDRRGERARRAAISKLKLPLPKV